MNKPKPENVGIVVTARVHSRRLHKKVLQKIGQKYTLEILLQNVLAAGFPVVLAIPKAVEDNILQDIGEAAGVQVYRGQDDSPLHRLAAVADEYGYDHIVRITADDILIDSFLLKRQIDFHINGRNDYTFMRRCPEGTAGEVIRSEYLIEIAERIKKPTEYTSYFLKTGKIKEFYPPFEYQFEYRCTMDYPEDLQVLRAIYGNLAEPFGTLDVINFLRRHNYITEINRLPLITFYTVNRNYGEYVIECAESVINAEGGLFEYIIVDDDSCDDSCKQIMEWYGGLDYEVQKKVRIVKNKKNIGLPASCNKVLSMARGKYIMRIDADDKIDSRIIPIMLMHIEQHAGVISGYREFGDSDKEVLENHFHPGCCLLNRACVNELKYREDLQYFEGAEFFRRFNELYKIAFVPEVLWSYRRHGEQKTADKNREEREVVALKLQETSGHV